MNNEISYLMGALRDGNFDVRPGKNYELRIYQDDEFWLAAVSEMFQRNFGIAPKISGKLLRINNKKAIKELLAISEYKNPQGQWETPSLLRTSSDEERWWYVSGFWDSEGGVPLNHATTTQTYVSFDQKNKEALEFVRSFLVKEGFRPTNLTFTGNVWQFRLTRRAEVKEFATRIISFHREKFRRLMLLIASVP